MTQLQQDDDASARGGADGGEGRPTAEGSGGFRGAVARSWPPTPWEVLAVTTTLLAVAIAVGPVTGVVPVAVLSVVWFVAIAYVVVALAVQKRRWSVAHWVFVAGVGAAALRMCALGIVQLVRGRESLFWNIDWRYHATQAYGIARFGGVSDSLDYAGRPVHYHAGPAWIAGALHGTVGAPVNFVLFVLVPLASVMVIGISAYRLLRCIGAGRQAAFLAVAVAMNLPYDPPNLALHLLHGSIVAKFLDARTWWFAPSMMLNSLFAIAVGLTAAWMILAAPSHLRAAFGGLGLASVYALKPQFFVGFSAVLALGYVINIVRRRERGSWARVLVVAGSVGVSALVFVLANPETSSFTGLTVDLGGVLRRSFLTSQTLLLLALGTIVLIVAIPAARRSQSPRLLRYALCAVLSVAALLVFFDTTTFLLDGAEVAQARAIGLALVRSDYDFDLKQAMVPATLVVVMIAMALLFGLFRRASGAWRVVPVVATCLVLALPAPFVLTSIAHPTGRAAYRWTEEKDLAALYAQVPTDRGLWVSSDLADPGVGLSIPLLAVNLTSLGDAQFYLSQANYSGWTEKDVVRRIDSLQRFYSTPWSPWHDEFLQKQGIRYVLVSDRCPANWDPSDFPGRVVGSRGVWTLLEVDPTHTPTSAPARSWPEFTGKPTSGAVDCLSGRTTT